MLLVRRDISWPKSAIFRADISLSHWGSGEIRNEEVRNQKGILFSINVPARFVTNNKSKHQYRGL